ncbi:helix-turn-helix domain-containing protein [Chryseobacterium daecheongense]|uniref:helix-turn-helix domain-containing protein n=1 Tax=Chryseobacterium daecheongense TaxID=192389 RepID=UPI001FD66C5C|nr:helix-turn-helix domain-containing protein [Chryseobacterium daecheongense]UOU97016.1 helix-turn-helix domain-containing protein [Chryseobacterium daecheongense]
MDGYTSYRISAPSTFKDVFSHFYYAENKSEEPIEKTLLPSYQTIMIFNLGTPASFISKNKEEITVERCMVLGPIKHAFNYILPENAEILVCNFKDDAFFRFFGNAGLTDGLAIHPDELLHQNCFTTLWSELKKIDSNENRIEALLDFCTPYLRNRNEIAEQIASFDRKTFSPIKEISQKNKLSERSLQANHKKHFGYTSKEMYRYQRFLKAIQIIQTSSCTNAKIDWFDVINQCGYYDQSQLIKDFQHYIHLSPSKYLKFQESICDPKN